MLNDDQIIDAMSKAQSITPDEFLRLIADDVPQTMMDRLMTELVAMFTYHPKFADLGAPASALGGLVMSGFQIGYCLAKAAEGKPLESGGSPFEFEF